MLTLLQAQRDPDEEGDYMAFEQLMAEAAVKKGKDGKEEKKDEKKEEKKDEKKDTKKPKKDEAKKEEPAASQHHHGFHAHSKGSEPATRPS